MTSSGGVPRLSFDVEIDISSMYGVQWVASQPTHMGMDCAVKLAELAVTADRVFVPSTSVKSPELSEDETLPPAIRMLAHSEANAKGFLYDLRRVAPAGTRETMEKVVYQRLANEPWRVAAWTTEWMGTISSSRALIASALDWIGRQPSAYGALAERAGQRIVFASWDSEEGDRPDEELAKMMATDFGIYDQLAASPIGSNFRGKTLETATDDDRTLYMVLCTILIRSIVYQEEAAYLDRVLHPHPLRMPILASLAGRFDPPPPEQSLAAIFRFLRPTDPEAAGLGCSLPLILPLVTQRLEAYRHDLRRLLRSPDLAEREAGQVDLIASYSRDLLELHSAPFSTQLRSELAEIERANSMKGLRDQLRTLNTFASEVLRLNPLDVAIDVVEEIPAVTLKSLVRPFRVIFAGLAVELDAMRGSIQRLAFLKRTRLSREVIIALRDVLTGAREGLQYQTGKGSYAEYT